MTDDLIERLAGDVAPVRRFALPRRLALGLVAGVVLAAVVMVPWLGLRPDLATAWADPIFWTKFGYTALLAIGGFLALERLSRPGLSGRGAFVALLLVFAGAVALGVMQAMGAPPEAMPDLMFGHTNLVCPVYIVTLSLPVLAATLWVLRGLAPTNLALAGFAAGLLSGGAGAWVYAFHCGENGLAFLAMWYTLGVLLVGGLGALAGPRLLRW